MESLSDTVWDVVLCGTGFSQSLLALSVFLEFTTERAIYLTDPGEGPYPAPAKKCYISTKMTITETPRLL